MKLQTTTDQLLRTAIADRRLIAFTLDGCKRIAEPHDYGVMNGSTRLFFYQVGGESRSGKPIGWRWAELPKIEAPRLLDDRFPGARPAPSGKHIRWDRLYASVSRRAGESGDDKRE
jgi:hypothetical protein